MYDRDTFVEKYGFTPRQFIDCKGLMGDQSDNIPGLPGIGEKTAQKFIIKYGSVEGLLSHTDELKGKTRENVEDNAQLAVMLTFPVLPSHRYNDIYSLYNKETNFKPVGSGQYKVKSYDNSRKLVLVPNDEYYGDAAENTITFSVTPYKQKAYQLLESSNISMLYLKDPERKTFFTKSGIKEINFPSNEVEYLGFNFKKTDMQNAYFRKAIASSINCKRIIQQCYSNSGIVNDSVYYPNYMGENSKRAAYPHSIDKADSYMKKAEFTDTNHGI